MIPPELTRIQDPALAASIQRLYELIGDLDTRLKTSQADLTIAQRAVADVRTLERVVRQQAAEIQTTLQPVPQPFLPSGGTGTTTGGGKIPVGGPQPGAGGLDPPPSQLSIVQALAAAHPVEFANSCPDAPGGSYDFLDLLVTELRLSDPRWGYNGKRGDITDISVDIVDYYWGADLSLIQHSPEVYIFDVIGAVCPPGNAYPAWQDQTAATAAAETIGRWVFPRP